MPGSLHSPRHTRFQHMLVAARKEKGLTQTHVAVALGKPQSFVAKYEGGERRLDVIEFLDIAAVLGLDAAAFLAALQEKD